MKNSKVGTPECEYMWDAMGVPMCRAKCVPCKLYYDEAGCDEKERQERLFDVMKKLVAEEEI